MLLGNRVYVEKNEMWIQMEKIKVQFFFCNLFGGKKNEEEKLYQILESFCFVAT